MSVRWPEGGCLTWSSALRCSVSEVRLPSSSCRVASRCGVGGPPGAAAGGSCAVSLRHTSWLCTPVWVLQWLQAQSQPTVRPPATWRLSSRGLTTEPRRPWMPWILRMSSLRAASASRRRLSASSTSSAAHTHAQVFSAQALQEVWAPPGAPGGDPHPGRLIRCMQLPPPLLAASLGWQVACGRCDSRAGRLVAVLPPEGLRRLEQPDGQADLLSAAPGRRPAAWGLPGSRGRPRAATAAA